MMNAKEFWISKFPDAETDWGKTGHDDRFQVRMMEEYAEYRVKNCLIADVVGQSEKLKAFADFLFHKEYLVRRSVDEVLKEFENLLKLECDGD